MTGKKLFVFAAVCAGALAVSFVTAEPAKDSKPGAAGAAAQMPQMQLPPGWTAEDMQACAAAATPGKMHEVLAQGIGTWVGKNTIWMAPNTPPMQSDCTATVTSIMDGRYIKSEMAGDMPGMGPFTGLGFSGFDNVSQKFVGSWMDNSSTGIMNGTGELSADGKTLTWNFTYNCPIARKAVTMRQIETMTTPTTKTLVMYGPDPKTGQEFKMMSIELTKK